MNNNNEKNITLFEKIKSLFNSIFKCNKKEKKLIPEKSIVAAKEEKFQNLKRGLFINKLAEKLLYGEIGPTDVEDEYLDELMDYFKNDIKDTKSKIEECKRNIINMQADIIKQNT